MGSLNPLQIFAVLALPVLFAITVHESAHGWMAKKLGDKTAFMLGRLTLNPIKHIDPVGTLLVPLVTYLFSGFLFGWAKPVPVTWGNLNNPRRDMGYVALAGPGANLLMALGWALVIKLSLIIQPISFWDDNPFLMLMCSAGVLFNVLLMVLNLLPILPLDGGRIVNSLLPPRLSDRFSRLEPIGLIILVGLLVSGILGRVLWPLTSFIINILPASDSVKYFWRLI